ncbi:hypothetical protein N7478_006682 [Penicillium angulare]|uniref:uncharacterized protein n=1 Tax=Penicillium angulare TaxID=116970 RepID=UPI00254215AD|nr:uncharacterized protein N7478_006682 [Penicillium angulare]KAJ5281310.1 hypothetical protein N7478_006682 [Penicillium angulare]
MADEECDTTDVVICGCGPTGAMLSAYLGQMNINNIVLEKHMEITTDPRGIALDEDGIRCLQGTGIYSSIFSEIGASINKFKFIGGKERVLEKKPFFEMDFGTTQGGTGHVGFMCHKQPILEKHLRRAMSGLEVCELRSGCEITGLFEDEKGTVCEYRDEQGKTRRIRSRFFVGADGKTGFTRKQYLEPKGIFMEKAHQAFYEETWVALNWEIQLPNEQTHPNFALWALGFTPEQVYDLFFPINFRFICNPNRSSVCGRFGLPEDRLWRFEFVILPGEDGEEMSTSKKIKEVVFPYITHAGSRYGLSHDVAFPEDCIKVLRSRPFKFSARSCNKWSDGRVILCGDAAHVFPPFGGQGIASGFRDAISLSWRLAVLCRPQYQGSNFHEKVLMAWYKERKQQLEMSLALTVQNGEFVTESNALKIFMRDMYFWLIQLVPSWREELNLGPRKDGMIRYEHSQGFPFIPEFNGGVCLPQVYCKSIGGLNEPGGICFTDDVIFNPRKTGLFQLLIYLKSTTEIQSAQEIAADIDDMSNGEVRAGEMTILVEDMECKQYGGAEIDSRQGEIYRLTTGDEFARSPLCKGRPEPKFYDPYYLGKQLEGTREDLRKVCGVLLSYLQEMN